MRSFIALLIVAALPSTVLADAAPSPLPTTPPGGIAIVNLGNGDLAGYRIVVAPDGRSASVDGAGSAAGQLPAQLVTPLFTDAAAAMPLSRLLVAPCSSGAVSTTGAAIVTPTLVSYRGETSPDLVCATDPKAAALYEDVRRIVRAMYVANYRSRAVGRYATGTAPDVSAPAPAPPPPPSSGGGYHGY